MSLRLSIIIFLAWSLSGCSMPGTTAGPVGSQGTGEPQTLPQVVQKGAGAQWVQFTPKTNGALYSAIVSGPQGDVWFIDENAASLVRIAPSGATKEFSLSAFLNDDAVAMTVGSDGNFYIGGESTSILRVTPAGKAVSFAIPSGDSTSFNGMALGSDGNVWFAESNHIGRIEPSGKIKEFPYPSGYSGNQYGGVAPGSDGNVWFAESSGNAIGRVVPSTGKITMFPISTSCIPAAVVPAMDKNVWFACLASAPLLGSITPSGKIATYAVGGTFNDNETLQFCAEGPDGEPWCASRNDGNVFRVNTSSHTVTTFTPPLGSTDTPDALTAGSDGNVWVDTVGGKIDVFVSNPLKVTPDKLAFTALNRTDAVTVSEKGTSSWSASSSNTAVAKVAQGHSNSTFEVTSAGAGSCKVTISDGAGNTVAIKVTVS